MWIPVGFRLDVRTSLVMHCIQLSMIVCGYLQSLQRVEGELALDAFPCVQKGSPTRTNRAHSQSVSRLAGFP